MCWHFAPQAEIARCADERCVEVAHPDAIHEHTRRQRVFDRGDLLSKLQSAALVLKWLALVARDHRKELPRHFGARIRCVAADENPRIVCGINFLEDHCLARCALAGRVRIQLFSQLGNLVLRLLI